MDAERYVNAGEVYARVFERANVTVNADRAHEVGIIAMQRYMEDMQRDEYEANEEILEDLYVTKETFRDIIGYIEQDPAQTLVPDGRVKDARALLDGSPGGFVRGRFIVGS